MKRAAISSGDVLAYRKGKYEWYEPAVVIRTVPVQDDYYYLKEGDEGYREPQKGYGNSCNRKYRIVHAVGSDRAKMNVEVYRPSRWNADGDGFTVWTSEIVRLTDLHGDWWEVTDAYDRHEAAQKVEKERARVAKRAAELHRAHVVNRITALVPDLKIGLPFDEFAPGTIGIKSLEILAAWVEANAPVAAKSFFGDGSVVDLDDNEIVTDRVAIMAAMEDA